MALSPTFLAAAASVTLLVFWISQTGRRPKGLPPGPPTLPLIGNIHQIPKEKPHLQFQKWAQEYGPVYSLILGTKVMIVLSSDQAVKDLLDKRSNIYSSRAETYLAGEILSDGLRMVLMEYGETWRMVRRLAHNALNMVTSRAYVPYQDLENKRLLLGFLDEPDKFAAHVRRYTNSFATQMVFGFRTTSIDDPKLKQLYAGIETFSMLASTGTALLLDLYPVLRRLPDFLLPIRQFAREAHKKEYGLYVGHYLNAKKKLKEGTAKPCFCVDVVRAQEKEGFSDGIAAYTSGTVLEAGSDTIAASLIGFVQAMLCFPEAARAAQEELDRVCGDRLPDLSDVADLPYIRGCVKESLRWMPTTILGIPHAVICDDEYMGYKIPKGAAVTYNVWAIQHDAKRHPEPWRFDPGRWRGDAQTSSQAATNVDASRRDVFLFGAGRRLCPGMHVADRSMFLAISRLLWAFDFRRAVDPATGRALAVDPGALNGGLLVVPKPFPADIVPRSPARADAVRAAWAEAEKDLLDEEGQWRNVPEFAHWKDYYDLAETAVDV